jgi:hypothetical protein
VYQKHLFLIRFYRLKNRLRFTIPCGSDGTGFCYAAAGHNQVMGQLLIDWKTAIAVIAGIPILTTIGVYLLARFSSVFDAYAGERAKLMAQFHNLDRLVQQTEKLAMTTEAIKARISFGIWDQQMRWTAKRDSYMKLMETLGERYDVEARNMLLEQIRRREPTNALYPAELDRALLRTLEVQSRLVQAACTAPLVVSEEAHQILVDVNAQLRKVNYDLDGFEHICDANLQTLQSGLNNLLAAARQDIGPPNKLHEE